MLCGCGAKRSADVIAIKQSYSGFRSALQDHDYFKATNYISEDYLALYPKPAEKIADHFRTMPDADMELRSDSWVQFDRKDKTKAWLFPHRPPTVGYGFIHQTNGWKIKSTLFPLWIDFEKFGMMIGMI